MISFYLHAVLLRFIFHYNDVIITRCPILLFRPTRVATEGASVCVCAQVKNLNLRLEQEIHKRNLSQSDLKMQNQQVSVLRSSEKQLKQEINHLLDMKQILEKQNQELRRSKHQIKIYINKKIYIYL